MNSKQSSSRFLIFFLLFAVSVSASGQFPIRLPSIPKTEKPKNPSTETAKPTTSGQSRNSPSSARPSRTYENPEPTTTPVVINPMVFIKAVVTNEYWKMPNASNVTSWIPEIKIHLFWDDSVPLATFAEFYNPDGTLWFTESLQTAGKVLRSNETWTLIKSKSTNATGVYSVKVKNKTTGAVIFAGKFRVNKFLKSFNATDKNKQGFYVDHDWLLPLGMVSLDSIDLTKGNNGFVFDTWLEGDVEYSELEAELHFNGKLIAKRKATSGMSNDERAADSANIFLKDSIVERWGFWFDNVVLHNGNSYNIDDNKEWYESQHWLDKNPGQYVFKVFRNGTQIREMAFAVGADGRLVRPPYSDAFTFPTHGILLPAKVMGNAKKLNPATVKTDMFYGNPINVSAIQ